MLLSELSDAIKAFCFLEFVNRLVIRLTVKLRFSFWGAETQSLSAVILHHQLLQRSQCSGVLLKKKKKKGLCVNHLQSHCTKLIARGWCKKQNNGE